jgi:RHS repeat-associated protein
MKRHLRFTLIALFLVAGSALRTQAQATGPDDNPTANTGALKAQIETGGSYDAHSGNATRIIPDLHFPGALGVYGLDFIRYWNSLRNDRDPGEEHLHPEPIPDQPTDFGSPGWSHSWSWKADYDDYVQITGEDTDSYTEWYTMMLTITFPDGHASKFKIFRSSRMIPGTNWPPDPRKGQPYYAAHGESTWSASGEIHDHLEGMAENGSEFWLYRADGGSVHFKNDSAWGYQATQVFDPHGLLTTLHYNTEGNLDYVEQDGGRRLTLRWDCYSPPGQQNSCMQKVIGRVENTGSGGMQAVEYGYSWLGNYLTLTHAYYQNDPIPGQSVPATYTYATYTPPAGFFPAGPFLVTADDPRFAGPMRQIRYTYRDSGCRPQGQPPPPHPDDLLDYFYASPTSIASEQSWRTYYGTSVPIIVSSFTLGCFDGTRSESNGLGGFRKFFYGHSAGSQGDFSCQGYELAKLTDFTTVNPLPSNVPFERQNYFAGDPRQIWDGRGILTEAFHTDGSGLPSEVRHTGSGDGSSYNYDRIDPQNLSQSAAQDFSRIPNPYHHWLFSKTDERHQTTTYKRDSRRRVTHIGYHDVNYNEVSGEDFTYDPVTNQITTHTLPSGAVLHFEYNGSNQLQREWNSVDGSSAATTYTYYGGSNHPEWTGLVATALNARAAANGAAYSTKMEYNGRFQITKVHYPPTGGNPDPTVIYGYDFNGNCTAITDEMGHQSLYEFDDYRRCISYTEPLNASNWNGSGIQASRRWDWIYDRDVEGVGKCEAYAHTKNEWRIQVEPAFNAAGDRKMTSRKHDLQNRIVREERGWIQPAGAIPYNNPNWHWSNDGEAHSYTYDKNGQKESDTLYIAPSNRVTTYTYDLRNRLKETIETKRADQTVNPTTTILYDPTNNKTDVTFPDGRSQHWQDYDPFGQAWTFKDERVQTTNLSYQWGPMKKLAQVITHRAKDGGGREDQPTSFYYDGIGRPQWTIFPDGTSELTTYLFGQVDAFKTRRDQTKRVHYDARGREAYHTWDSNAAPRIDRSWDDANRLSSITNIFSSIDFGYDDAGQVIWEGDEVAGSGGRTQTNYYRYPDGSVAHLHYPGGAYVRHDYAASGQLAATGWDDDNNNWWMKLAAYTYLTDGKVGQIDFGNGVRTGYGYDERGMVQIVDHYRPGVRDLSWRQYWRDNRDRITAFQKSYNPGSNPMENGRGDRFAYDDEGELTDGWYNAIDPAGTPSGWTRKDHFSYDELGNRQGDSNNLASRNSGQNATSFVRRDNGLNQYTHWWPAGRDFAISHDDNSPFTGYTSSPGNGVLMADGWLVASYNALNQPVAMIPYSWSDAIYFGYDPLGRCVKRWTGASSNVYSNPATYFHYDGWNLLQEGNNAWGPARVYVHGNRVDEIVWSYNTATGGEGFHQYDARGDCTLLTDRSGNILEQYEYDAFGQPYFYGASGNSIGAIDAHGLWTGYSLFGNRFLFTGREWLSDLKVYDYRNRMYQPELGRFLQPDPKEFAAGDYNLYRYCHNDPVNKTDPTGLDVAEFTRFENHLGSHLFQSTTYTVHFSESGNHKDNNPEIHLTDKELKTKDGRRTAGLTQQKVSIMHAKGSTEIYADLHIDWWVRRSAAANDPSLPALEKQHTTGLLKEWAAVKNDLGSYSTIFGDWWAATMRGDDIRTRIDNVAAWQHDTMDCQGCAHDYKMPY